MTVFRGLRFRSRGKAYFYSIYRVDVLHAIKDYPSHFLERFVRAHYADSVPLHEDIALC